MRPPRAVPSGPTQRTTPLIYPIASSPQALQGAEETNEANEFSYEASFEPSFSTSILAEDVENFLADESSAPSFTSALQESSFSQSFAFSAQQQESAPNFSASLDEDEDDDDTEILTAGMKEDDAPSFSASLDDDAPIFTASIQEDGGFGSFPADDDGIDDIGEEVTAPSFTTTLQEGRGAPDFSQGFAPRAADKDARARVAEVSPALAALAAPPRSFLLDVYSVFLIGLFVALCV